MATREISTRIPVSEQISNLARELQVYDAPNISVTARIFGKGREETIAFVMEEKARLEKRIGITSSYFPEVVSDVRLVLQLERNYSATPDPEKRLNFLKSARMIKGSYEDGELKPVFYVASSDLVEYEAISWG